MPLNTRVLQVQLSMPNGQVILDQSLDMHVRIHKAALQIQNRCIIDVRGLSTSLRQQLLSQYTAWNKRQVDTGQASAAWINMQVTAGYNDSPNSAAPTGSTSQNTAVIFVGQVVLCEPSSGPPNIGTRITCYSRQIDKTTFASSPQTLTCTFYEYVKWAAGQMGFGSNFICQTSYNDVVITNPGRGIYTLSALLVDIQNMYRPNVAAFIDDNQLIVKDRNAIINTAAISQVTEFIDTPQWNEWGVNWKTLMDPTLKLAQAANLTSLMNPGVNGTYVITELDYDLASREGNFYVTANGSPPA